MHDRTIHLPRGPMRIRVHGEGPPLIWSHGVFFPIDVDNHSTLGRVLDELEGFTVVRYDARGHGRTPAASTVAGQRWDRLGQEVLELADALGFERFSAGGISMGSAVTLSAAVHAPERICAMLLLALPTAWATRPAEQRRYRDLAALGSSTAVAAHVQEDLDQMFTAETMPASLRAMVDHLGQADWVELERVILGAAESDLPPPEAIAGLATRTLLRAWPDDVGHPLSTAEAVSEAMPGADYQRMAGFDDAAGMLRAFETLRGLARG